MELTPERFFEKAVPAMVLKQFDDFIAETGVLAFEVRGAGDWAVHFGDVMNPVTKGKAEKFDLFLSFTPAAFTGFVDGTLDLGAAIASKDIVAKGTNFMLLESFGDLINPPVTQLGWDASTVG